MRSRTGVAAEIGLAPSLRTNEVEFGFASGHPTSVEFSVAPVLPVARPQVAARRHADRGAELSRRGEFSRAAECFASASQLQPDQAEFHYKLACTLWSANKTDSVERHLLAAARLDPQSPSVHEALALWFLRYDRIESALKHSAAAANLDPHNPAYAITHADVLAANGQPAAAWDLIAPLVSAGAGGPWLARMYAKLAPKIGREAQAVDFLRESLQAPALSTDDRARIHFAAARLLDGIGNYDQAFHHATMGKSSAPAFDAAAHTREVSGRIRYYTKKRLVSLARATNASRRPVFVVGMPRSGTSLIEQILASHPAVFGAGELKKLTEVAATASSSPWAQGVVFPECFDRMSMRRADELAGEYLSVIDALDMSATYVIDKMPMNYLFLGIASLLFPECRVIHCVRDARDTCLSCYFTDFGDRQPYTSNPADLASVYGDYRRLMDHWKQVLPLAILDVRYEDMVADQEGQTRRMLQFLDLPWDERCLRFHQTSRPIATASREQVRQPIYSSSVGRWKNYRKHISQWMGL